ncbi:MAG: hypothetical protein P0Y55_09660 [Candidatus Cohnella colombiensis]|uniref:Uncharacterized protein n=1 Tax=Candidatus Cohnella colombiensis TaxID=3121368 RepID=A0AA95ESZ8_9BACL|nr:MAG: hypothetical protein P0Y55_09660 [Cohnella sp.]
MLWQFVRYGTFVGGLGVWICLQGCLNAPTSSLSAKEALALSASALSGSERYNVSGEVTLINPSGMIASHLFYDGKISEHGKLNMQWRAEKEGQINGGFKERSAKEQKMQMEEFEPLEILDLIKGNKASVRYAKQTANKDEFELIMMLNDEVSRAHIANELRTQLNTIAEDEQQLLRQSASAQRLYAQAKQELEEKLARLQVTTECRWVASSRSWFPSQLSVETTMRYQWKNNMLQEKRVSQTHFLPSK